MAERRRCGKAGGSSTDGLLLVTRMDALVHLRPIECLVAVDAWLSAMLLLIDAPKKARSIGGRMGGKGKRTQKRQQERLSLARSLSLSLSILHKDHVELCGSVVAASSEVVRL
uniref:Uncharacterized protein n=1 Tax=Craspedostauros australis TaxID=1486917 RepID=A0A7R9ZNJ7_9STRA